MITQPTTPQILRDLAIELEREILPRLPDATDQVRLQMVMAVLRQCAVRAGEEIAVLSEEAEAYRAYGTQVAEATGRADVAAAVAAIDLGTDRQLDVVSQAYCRASDALGRALDAAMDAGASELVAAGERLLGERVANEQRMAGVATAGR